MYLYGFCICMGICPCPKGTVRICGVFHDRKSSDSERNSSNGKPRNIVEKLASLDGMASLDGESRWHGESRWRV
jgi:hypothetical protein